MRKQLFIFICSMGLGMGWAEAQLIGNESSFADRDNYDIRQYTSENGLPQNSATALLLDKNDFLWIATQNGLARFDGRRFRIYDKFNTPAIQSSRFWVIAESSQREVLIGSTFDPAIIYKVSPDYKVGIDTARSRLPHKFLHANAKGVFDCTPLFKSYAGDANAGVPSLLQRLSASQSFLVLNDNEVVVRDSTNEWYYLNNSRPEIHRLPIAANDAGRHVFALHGLFCVFSQKEGWRFFSHGRETAVQVDESVARLTRLWSAMSQLPLILGPGGDQVIARQGNDIYELNLHKGVLKAELIFEDLKELNQVIATSFLHDRKNRRLFVATVTTGFLMVTKRLFRTLNFKTPDRLDNAFKAILLLPRKKLLTQKGILERKAGGDQFLFTREQQPDGNCFYRARDGSIWTSRDRRLHIYDSTFSKVLAVDSLTLDSYISCIVEDAARTIWISTLTSLLKMEKGSLKYVVRHHPHFINHTIESITEVSPARLWIASRNGIYDYDVAADSIGEKPVLAGVYARNFYRAKDNSLWIGTYGNGYYKFHEGRFIALPMDQRSYLSTSHTFLEDGLGFFWISTNHGLFRIRKKDLDDFAVGRNNSPYLYHIDKSFGFNTNEFNGGCTPPSQVDEEGNFYFPSLDGIVYFNPASLQPEMPDRSIFVDQFFVDTTSLDYGRTQRIRPDFHRLVVEVATPFYGLEENLKLEYTLDSGGGKWYPVSREGRITINRLPHGKYALLVRKHNAGEGDRFTHMTIPFEVLPHWYNTWFFYIAAALLVGSLLYLLYKLRTRILLRNNLRLQQRVDERTAELAQSTVIKERLLSVIMHDIRSPMFSQAVLIDHLHANLHKMRETQLNEMFLLLKDSTNRIGQLSTDFLVWYESQDKGFSVRSETIELSGFIKDTTVIYESIAVRKGLSFDWSIPPDLTLVSDRNILAIVIRNLVDNAVKYTNLGSVGISAFHANGEVRIRVKDTGQGMPPSKIAEIMSYREEEATAILSTFGYRFIMGLVGKLNGRVDIESTPGSGTSVVVSFKA
jgi:signal transduction histidine kinase